MTDWLSEQAAKVERGVEKRERDGKPARAVVAERSYPTAIDDLWNALTDPERMKRWFMPVSGELQLGGHYQLEGNAGGTILECTPPDKLHVTWEFGDRTSWVVVTLEARGDDETRLRLEHIGLEEGDYLAFWEQFGPGAVGVGWDLSLLGLAEHVIRGGSPTGKGDDAWLMTGEARPFAETVSRAWGEADMAFGTDSKAAEGAASRTFAFYTGDSQQS